MENSLIFLILKLGDFLENDRGNTTEMDFPLTQVSIQNLNLKTDKSKYTKEAIDVFSAILFKIFDSDSYHERILIISKYINTFLFLEINLE